MNKGIGAVCVLVFAKMVLLGLTPAAPIVTVPTPPIESHTQEEQWALDFLGRIGNPAPIRDIMGLVVAWQRAEGGTAGFNPLNTTMVRDGSTCYNYNNGTCVRNYTSYEQGMVANVDTIMNGRYPHILHGLQTNNIDEALNDEEFGVWGTGLGAVQRTYNEWLFSHSSAEVQYEAPALQVDGTGCLEPNVTSAIVHSPGLQEIIILPGQDWSFNENWVITEDQTFCPGQSFVGGGVCNAASRYSNVARNMGLRVTSQYHGYIYDDAVPQEDNLAIMSNGWRGGQDLTIFNPTPRTVRIVAVLQDGILIVYGTFI